jgi:hypothetical protein
MFVGGSHVLVAVDSFLEISIVLVKEEVKKVDRQEGFLQKKLLQRCRSFLG